MFNRLQRFWTSIKIAIDVAVLTVAFVLSYYTRFDVLHGALALVELLPLRGGEGELGGGLALTLLRRCDLRL